ncbi:type II toxin-antitoxin system HipA family toxin [Chitinibacter bivalviorum]|uniref:Type II toxin-antitoxin system HipA family toxin n=1 Tax=Chitinibacter bivalviorum TaxID=2739434 RepID=A0A7H9BMB2_9NEIS|nr:type II toxin-antitoxin system HipA family toxin [Chitinibacter bivalviorum]
MKKVDVFYEGWGERWHLATLADDGRKLLFEYSPEALAQGLELSPRHLKLQAAAYSDFPAYQLRLPGLIADALPDGWGLLLMDRLFRQNGIDPARASVLDRLSFIGHRAMGALSFQPASISDIPTTDVQLLNLAQQAQTLLSGEDSAILKQLALMGGSPHGARPKVLVHYDPANGQLSTQCFAGSTPWLVKFQAQNEHKEVCAIEYLYAQLARACALDIPATQYFDLSPTLAAFGIARFDVAGAGNAPIRIPTHTLAGLLHADFRLPGSVDYSTFLRATRFLTRDEREVQKAYQRTVFNVLFNNRDDHPKNFSYLLGQDRRWQLSPAYDLTYCAGPAGYHQMDVCGEALNINRAHLLQLAQQNSLAEFWAAQVIEQQLTVAETFTQKAKDYAIRSATVQNLANLIAANAARLRGG